MTIATISKPSEPVTCHPDHKPCETERSECQFSFSRFQYICCQDRDDIKAPECPKYHVTLRTLCGGINDASCPRSYKCLPSRFDPSIEICCKPNSSIFYPEPDTCEFLLKLRKSKNKNKKIILNTLRCSC